MAIGIETDRGLWVQALRSPARNPMRATPVLADLVRTDRHNHLPMAGDCSEAEAHKVFAPGHQNLIWARTPMHCARHCASTTR